jgi:transposase InsO family protein
VALKHRITVLLRREGIEVNRKAVQRHMRDMGIVGICPRPNLSRRAHGEQVYPYLLRDLTCTHPNQVWGIDVTYIPLQTGWMYLVAVLDWFSRYVVSWELDDTLQLPFVLEAVKRAGTAIRGATSPARTTVSCCWRPTCRLAWMARGGRSTKTSWSGCGAQSSTRRCTPMTMPAHVRREQG